MDTPNQIEADRQELARQFIRELLWNPGTDTDAVLSATPDECFPPGHHREVVATVRRLRSQGLPADIPALGAELPGAAAFLAESMNFVAIGGLPHIAAKLRTVAAAIEARRQMADYSSKGTDLEGAREELDRIASRFHLDAATGGTWDVIDGGNMLDTEPAAVETVYPGLFDRGDMLFLVAQLKARKTWFLGNMALCLASGRPFLRWSNGGTPLRVLVAQLEVAGQHYHRRIKMASRQLGIGSEDLGDRVAVWSGRGKAWSFDGFREAVVRHRAAVAFVDPLYLVTEGDENLAADVKPTIRAFAKIAEETGVAIVISHHDAKGSVGQRDTRDRGAGSNVLGRAADVVLTLSPHQDEELATVVSGVVRNYAGFEPFTVEFDRGAFTMSDLPPLVAMGPQQARGGKGADTLRADAKVLADIIGTKQTTWGALLAAATAKGLSDRRIRNATAWAVSEGWLRDETTGYPRRRMLWTGALENTPSKPGKNTVGQKTQPDRERKGGFFDA